MPRKTKPDWMPKYVRFHKGRCEYTPYLGKGKFGKPIRLASETASIKEILDAYHAVISEEPKNTLERLALEFHDSPKFKKLSERTQKDYSGKYFRNVMNLPTKSGRRFGDTLLHDIETYVIQGYVDKRSEKAPVQANREYSYLAALFKWGKRYNKLPHGMANPCIGVEKNTEVGRRSEEYYVTDNQYTAFRARDLRTWYLDPFMEIAYLCRLRSCEILDIRVAEILDRGVDCRRVKGSRDAITLWSDRLRAAVQACLDRNATIASMYLFHDDKGQPLNLSTVQSAFQRAMVKFSKDGGKRFTAHDLKAKGVSDFEGNKKDAGGHRSEAMVDLYNRKKLEVKPTR